MDTGSLFQWIFLVAFAGALACFGRAGARRAARLRAHARRKQRCLAERRLQVQRTPRHPLSIAPRHAEAIRRTAEQAACHASAGRPHAANPFRRGTREFVLWETSYGLAAAQLAQRSEGGPGWSPHSPRGA